MASGAEKEVVKLNIVMTYPVTWSEYSVVSNYVQNFYDALGKYDFISGFRFSFEDGVLTMASDKSFSKDWLLYLGASKKRDKTGQYAGGFGEGFKIAALASIRDFSQDVVMESADWRIHVTSVPGVIGLQKVDFLAYEVSERPFQENAVLRIENVSDSFFQSFHSVLSAYYYKGNKLFGRCIVETEEYAIFESVRDSGDVRKYGYVFASYERRKIINIPLVICDHRFKPVEDDRDRDEFSTTLTRRCMNEVFQRLDARTSLEVLGYFQRAWGMRYHHRYNSINWNPVIATLIRNIEEDPKMVDQFLDKYRSSLIVRDSAYDEPDRWRRRVALLWFQGSSIRGQYHYVIREFKRLGIKTVCDLCQEMDGFTLEREPDERESCLISILKKAAKDILGDLILVDRWPGCRILKISKAPLSGYVDLSKGVGRKNSYGLKCVKQAENIYIRSHLFTKDRFSDAFATYAHELLHEYGGDSSVAFHKALCLMNIKIVKKIEKFRGYEREWREEHSRFNSASH